MAWLGYSSCRNTTIGLDHPLWKKDCNWESSRVKNGSGTYKGWNPWSTTTYLEWQVEKSLPPSFATTSLQIIWRSYSPVGTTAPSTHGHFAPKQTPTPVEYSHERRPTPSIQTKPFHQWSTLPSTMKGTSPSTEKSNASTSPIK